MKPFIKVTGLTKDFFSDREYEQDIIIGLNQISAIYEERVAIGENKYMKLTPDSMRSLKEYIDCEDCTGKGDSDEGST